MSDGGGIPSGAQGFSVVVLLYTLLNAGAAGLVVLMHAPHGEPFGYITITAVLMIINTLASFVQQVNFNVNFVELQTAGYNYAKGGVYTGAPAWTGTHTSLDLGLYELQLYCYNVESLMFLLWIGGLWRHVWRLRISILDNSHHMVSTMSKVAAILVPALLIGIANTPVLQTSPGIMLILCNIILAGSVAVGLVFLALVFYKYVSVQKYLGGSGATGFFARLGWRVKFSLPSSERSKAEQSRQGGSQLQSNIHDQNRSHMAEEGTQQHLPKQASAPRKEASKSYDKWLLIRFSICFVILCVMQIFLIYYSVARYFSSSTSYKDAKLDLTEGTAIISLVFFIPGVTLGLLIFIVFGTTGPFRREYAAWVRFLVSCGGGKKSSDSNSLHRSESVVRLTNLAPRESKGGESLNDDQSATGGKTKSGDGSYRIYVQPVGDDRPSDELQ